MAKRIFASKETKTWGLGRVLGVVCLVGVLGAGVFLGYRWFRSGVPALPVMQENFAPALEQARSAAGQNEWAKVRELLAPVVERISDAAQAPEALMLLAKAETSLGNAEAALKWLEQAQAKYGTGAMQHEIGAQYAQALQSSGKGAEAVQIQNKIAETAPPGQRAPGLCGLAQTAESAQDLNKAVGLYRQALADAAPNSAPWLQAIEGIGRINIQHIFSPDETPESKFYAVERGDNLMGIGVKLNTTQGLLTRANRMDDAARLNIGQRLKYTPKDFRIVIERSTCRLFLLDKGGLFKMYLCGLGMPGYETALGDYTIGNKEKNPTWHKPGSTPVPPLDPQNELGTRWMPLVPAAEGLPKDLGIHGTIHPETIGQYKSHGCPRMGKEDVEELYDLVVRSTPVTIVETYELGRVAQP